MTEDSSPKNRRAYGAIDAQERAYVVIEPLTDDPRLPVEAWPLTDGVTLMRAEEIAEHFNSHGSYIFRGGEPLLGDRIPQLFTAPKGE